MSQHYDQDARERPSDPTPNGPAPSGRRELPVWLQYIGVIVPLIVGLPTALFAIRSTTLDPLFWCLVLVVSIVVGFISVKRSGPGRVALVASAVGVAAAVGAAGSFGYQQGKEEPLASPTKKPSSSFSPDDPSTTAAGVRHEGELVISRSTTYIDLDAPPDDPQWGTLERDYRFGFDLQLRTDQPGRIDTLGSTKVLYSKYLTNASLKECQTTTGYTDEDMSFTEDKAGDVTCILTDQGRYSRLRFVSYESSTGVLTLVVTTWEKV